MPSETMSCRRTSPDGWRKEVHFFDSWPIGTTQEYLECFSEEHRQEAHEGHPHVLVDASPAYLYTAAAAPRVKRVVPHAKFVIILREPADRVVSLWRMMRRTLCPDAGTNGTETRCIVPSLEKMARELLPDSPFGHECSPYSEDATHTWGDCWGCVFSNVDKSACDRLAVSKKACDSIKGMRPAFMSYYAAQIAWWLSFFPPDRFLIITSQQLHNPDQQVQILNQIRDHAGVSSVAPFTHEQIAKIKGFQGGPSAELVPEDAAAVELMHAAFDVAAPHLQRLMDTFFPEQSFEGFPPIA
eukprot:jgi/Ulvmu1/2391/UM131_0002.1